MQDKQSQDQRTAGRWKKFIVSVDTPFSVSIQDIECRAVLNTAICLPLSSLFLVGTERIITLTFGRYPNAPQFPDMYLMI